MVHLYLSSSILLAAFPPPVEIIASPSVPIDATNYSLACKVYIPTEALGTVTIKWFGFLNKSTAIKSVVFPNISGATFNLDLIFTPIHTRDGGWYSCGVAYELYPIGSIKKVKLNIESKCHNEFHNCAMLH